MNDDLISHRKRAQALMSFILADENLRQIRGGPDGIRFALKLGLESYCKKNEIKSFSIDDDEKLGMLSIEQCIVFDTVCQRTFGHLWCEFGELSAA